MDSMISQWRCPLPSYEPWLLISILSCPSLVDGCYTKTASTLSSKPFDHSIRRLLPLAVIRVCVCNPDALHLCHLFHAEWHPYEFEGKSKIRTFHRAISSFFLLILPFVALKDHHQQGDDRGIFLRVLLVTSWYFYCRERLCRTASIFTTTTTRRQPG